MSVTLKHNDHSASDEWSIGEDNQMVKHENSILMQRIEYCFIPLPCMQTV